MNETNRIEAKPRGRATSLRERLLILVGAFTGTFVFLVLLILHLVVTPGFKRLEKMEAERNLDRYREALEREIHHLRSLNYDWAHWDDTLDFVKTGNQGYIDSNLNVPVYQTNGIQVLAVYNVKGERVWGMALDTEEEELVPVSDAAFPPVLEELHPLLRFDSNIPIQESDVTGIWRSMDGVFLVGSVPILTSTKEGPMGGNLIMARNLDDEFLDRLTQQTRVPAIIREVDSGPDSPDEEDLLNEFWRGNTQVFRVDPERIRGAILLPDIEGNSSFLLVADTSREITRHGRRVVVFSAVSLSATILIALLVLVIATDRLVLRPRQEVLDSIGAVAMSRDLSARLPEGGQDELSQVSEAINRMLDSLERAAEDKREMERRIQGAQKRESLHLMAASIAHNFNNLLHAVLGYLELASMDVSEEEPAGSAIREAEQAARRAAEISDLMRVCAGARMGDQVLMDLSELVESRKDEILCGIPTGIRLVEDLHRSLPPFQGNPDQIWLSLQAIIRNAIEAMITTGGEVQVRTGARECGKDFLEKLRMDESLPKGNYVFLSVRDTGEGMDGEVLSRIFDPFFSTRFPGRGLGLPAVQGIMTVHRGAVEVLSEPGKGTTVTLFFPVRIPQTPRFLHSSEEVNQADEVCS